MGESIVSQGVLAKNKDLMKAFGTDNQLEACRIILEKGEMQVRQKKEMLEELEELFGGDTCSEKTRAHSGRGKRGTGRNDEIWYIEGNIVFRLHLWHVLRYTKYFRSIETAWRFDRDAKRWNAP